MHFLEGFRVAGLEGFRVAGLEGFRVAGLRLGFWVRGCRRFNP